MSTTSRVFIASLKPAWSKEKMQKFVQSMKGTALVYMINHDKDVIESGELKENHTHLLIEYQTPRKISTVANLFEVEPNFIRICKSKKASLRYLTHLDDKDKYQYKAEEVIHNNAVSYEDLIRGQNLSDKEIARYLMESRGMELLGVVPSTKLRTIQSFISYERSNKSYVMMKKLHDEMDRQSEVLETMAQSLNEINEIAKDFQIGFTNGAKSLIPYLKKTFEAITEFTSRGIQARESLKFKNKYK